MSGSSNQTVGVRDATEIQPLGEALSGHYEDMLAVALGQAGDRDVIVSGSWDHAVQIWGRRRPNEVQSTDLLGRA